MLTDHDIQHLTISLKRIFVMPLSRSTFREVQNTILALSKGNHEAYETIMDTLLEGEEGKKSELSQKLSKLIIDYTIPLRVAKDVSERGEFIALVTSDIITQSNFYYFLNRVKRIDGEEFQFMSDPTSTIQILYHFLNRLSDLGKGEGTKKLNLNENFKADLLEMKKRIDRLLQP